MIHKETFIYTEIQFFLFFIQIGWLKFQFGEKVHRIGIYIYMYIQHMLIAQTRCGVYITKRLVATNI